MGCGGWSKIKHWLCCMSPGEESVGFPGPSSYSDSRRTYRKGILSQGRKTLTRNRTVSITGQL